MLQRRLYFFKSRRIEQKTKTLSIGDDPSCKEDMYDTTILYLPSLLDETHHIPLQIFSRNPINDDGSVPVHPEPVMKKVSIHTGNFCSKHPCFT